jgi:hypothetical protein
MLFQIRDNGVLDLHGRADVPPSTSRGLARTYKRWFSIKRANLDSQLVQLPRSFNTLHWQKLLDGHIKQFILD